MLARVRLPLFNSGGRHGRKPKVRKNMRVGIEEGGAALDNTAVSGLRRDIEVVDSTFYFVEVLNIGGKQ